MSSSPAKKNFTPYPLLWLSICFASGILAGAYLPDIRICLSAVGLITALASIFIRQKLAGLLLATAFCAAGALSYQISELSVRPDRLKVLYDHKKITSGDPIEIEGILPQGPELAVGGFFLHLEAERAIYKNRHFRVSGVIRLFAPTESELIAAEYREMALRPGRRLRVAGRFRREDNYRNPGVVPRRRILDQKGIDATGIIKSPLLVEILPDGETFILSSWLSDGRKKMIEHFRNSLNPKTGGVLIAALLGNRFFLDRETAEVFRRGGIFHVLVISGLHITFIGGLLLLLMRSFTGSRIGQFGLTCLILWLYVVAVGAGTPMIRAALMFTGLLFAGIVSRRGNLLNALGMSVLILLVWQPADLFDQSFQLTVVSVLAIVATAFPLIKRFQRIGCWVPSTTTPFPPNVSHRLKRFCETLYWREDVWKSKLRKQVWSARIEKKPYLIRLIGDRMRAVLRRVFEGVIVSLSVQIWLLPMVVFYFHRVAYIGVFLNLLVAPALAAGALSAFCGLFLHQLSPALGLPFIRLAEMFNRILLWSPELLIESGLAATRLPVYTGGLRVIYLLYFLPLLVLTVLLHGWDPCRVRRKSTKTLKNRIYGQMAPAAAVFWGLLFALIVFHPFSETFSGQRLEIDFLDVGQGDAAFVRFPNGQTLLIDGGGRTNFREETSDGGADPEKIFEPDVRTIGEAVVSEFLWEKGYAEIDYILATHADADHLRGLQDVAQNFRVRKVFFGHMPFENPEFAGFYRVLRRRGIEPVPLFRGDRFSIGKTQIEILHPTGSSVYGKKRVSANDGSLVLRITYGSRSFLFTGDIERKAERELVRNTDLEADVVKVAHHGSKTSSISEFIDAAGAGYAVISVGRESRFGHPDREVLRRWKRSGAEVLITGQTGTISFSTDGTDLKKDVFVR